MALFGSWSRRVVATAGITLALLVGVAGASAHRQASQREALNPIASAFAQQFAKAGASYLVTEMQNGALGSTGTTIGNLLGPFVQDPSVATQAQLEQIQAQLDGMQAGITDVKNSLSGISKDLTEAQFSLSVQNAVRIISLIDRSVKDLTTIAKSSSVAEREQVKADLLLRLGPTGGLDAAQESLRNYLVTGVPGAQGILESALKQVRGSAQPFITNTLATQPGEVYKYYAMYQAILFDLRLNYLRAKDATQETIKREFDSFQADLGAEYSKLNGKYVWRYSALDPRTWLLWSAGTTAPLRGSWEKQIRYFSTACCTMLNSLPIANGYGTVWVVPSVDQLRSLVKDATSPATAFLAQKGDFPSGVGPWVWAWNGPRSGCPAPTDRFYANFPNCREVVFNLDTGQVEDRAATDTGIGLVFVTDYYVQLPSARYP